MQVLVRGISAGGVAACWPRSAEQCQIERRGVPIRQTCRALTPLKCDTSSSSQWEDFKPEYRGQLTPSRPRTASSVTLQGGPFSSRWLRVNQGASLAEVLEALAQAEERAPSAVYVGVPEDYVSAGELIADLRSRGYRFHHFVDGSHRTDVGPPGEFIYYRWAGSGPDMVPAYATALEGVGVLVLSPDRKSLLLVWEYGNWKMITGNVDACEGMTTTVRREVKEEVGLELEEEMSMVGGWQDPRSRDETVNIMLCVFVAVAKSRNVQVDGREILEAQWFPIASMPTLKDELCAPSLAKNPFSMEWDLGQTGRNVISRAVARFLSVHQQGRGLQVTNSGDSGQDAVLSRRNLFS